ncbi:MAG: TIGR04013 family B12-binding domain/radical SAM domain-containing protein [Methanothrix sp.]|nr:TIGR04013 family B12-binding domain/radical SAM domain-containing protein [Methanothrix sp.]
MKESEIWFRYNSKNSYSIAALMPLVEAGIAHEPKEGIMLYSFASAQAEEVYREVAGATVDAVLIAGGPHPSALPEEVLEYFDFVVIGEGEETLPELLQVLREGRDPATVKGIAYRKKDNHNHNHNHNHCHNYCHNHGHNHDHNCREHVMITEKRPPVDLDIYPPFSKILAPLEISRGCPWGCTYCQTPRLFGTCMRHRSIPTIARYARRHRDIRFTSPNSLAYGSDGRTPRLEKVQALLEALAELKKPIYFGTFPSEVRPDFVSPAALEIIVKYCANKSLSLGGQSGSPAVLRSIGRGHGCTEVEEACELALDYGLVPLVDLIFGLPSETEADQRMSLDLVRWIAARGGKVRAHRFTPLPGTPLARAQPAQLAPDVEACLGRMALEGRLTGSW